MTTTTNGQTIGYIRTSSAGQNDVRQLDGVALDRTFTDTASGKNTDRPEFQKMLAHVRAGDKLMVHSMDRLSRSLADLEATVKGLTDKGVTVMFVTQNMTFTGAESSADMLMLRMLGAVAQFERALILERQREGIAIAKAKGVYTGRKAALDAVQVAKLKELVADGVAKTKIAAQLGVSRATVYSYMKG